ncbi:GFA family protein, partial [Mesorhizobium marinum]|uniref:GFA family protein n=1 Tax=Mesorhizobium marinum TaxID=3228790 RepID=UPI0034679109
MSRSYTGGCACGAIRYDVSGDPIVMVDCQCRQCQRASGGGHTSNMTFRAAEVKLAGDASTWETTGDGGTTKSSAFCPTCGSPVYMTFPDMPDIFIVRPASLDDPASYRANIVTWTAAAQPWDRVDPALP